MVHCAKCGAEIPEGANFCTRCGARTIVGERAGVNPPIEKLREAFQKMQREMERAFSMAARETEKAFRTARENIRQDVVDEPVTCSNCGAQNRGDVVYCSECGRKISQS